MQGILYFRNILVYQSEEINITHAESVQIVSENSQPFGCQLESIFIWLNITFRFGKSFQFFSILKGNMKSIIIKTKLEMQHL